MQVATRIPGARGESRRRCGRSATFAAWRVAGALAVAALALDVAGCGSRHTPTEPAGGTSTTALPYELSTEHFVLRYGDPTATLVNAYAAALEESWPRITRDLDTPGLPRIEGMLHATQAAFTAATGYQSTGSVEGPNRFHIVAVPLAPVVAVHEFAHNAMLHLAPGIGNNPVWLWEATAVWEAGQLVAPASVPCLAARHFPTLAELNQRGSSCSIYEVGFTLAEFIVDRWGLAGLRRLIGTHGDLGGALDITPEAFERDWQAFVERRYF